MSTSEFLANREYKYGWVTDIESEMIPRGLNEDTVRMISAKKHEPDWMLEFRLKAYRNWLNIEFPEVDYQDIIYYSAPKQKAARRVWMKSILNCCGRSRSLVFHCL